MPKRLRVLLLEDDPADAELLLHELRRANFEPDSRRVDNEADYLAQLDPPPDLILADFNLPQFDGVRALQQLQVQGLDIPFILVSGTIGEELAVAAMQQGASDYLLKDRLTRLGPAVELALEKKQLRDERRKAEDEIRLRNRELTLYNRVITAATSALEVEAVLETACRELARAFKLPRATAALLDDNHTSIKIVAEYAAEGLPSAVGTEFAIDESSATQYLLEHKVPLAMSDVQHDSRMNSDLLRRMGVRSLLLVPFVAHDQILGAISLESTEQREFSEQETTLAANAAAAAAQAVENARLFTETRRRLRQISSLREIDMAITASVDLRVTLNVLLDQVTTQLEVDAANVLLFNLHTQNLEFAAGRGFHTAALQQTRLRLGEGYAGQAALERRILSIPDLRSRSTDFLRSPHFLQEQFVVYYGIPLIAKGQVNGVLEIYHRQPFQPDREWLDFLHTLAGQAAIAIDNATLFNELQQSNIELTLAYDTTLEGWAKALELRDRETEGHTRRVADLTLRLARTIEDVDENMNHIRRGALLHDIGKMGIPDTILLKPGPLSDEEWKIMRQHPVYAHEMLAPISYLRPALDIPYCHHEKWNGTGYPQGLKGEDIPLAARIFAVVDVWDALRSDRPYRKAWPEKKVLDYLQEQSGQHFDPQVLEIFLRLLAEGVSLGR